MWEGLSITLILSPLMSAGLLIAVLLVSMLRKPDSAVASPLMPAASIAAMQLVADRAGRNPAGVGRVAEQEGHVVEGELRHESRHRRGRGHGEVDRAELDALGHLALAAEARRAEILDLVASAHALVDDLDHAQGRRLGAVAGEAALANRHVSAAAGPATASTARAPNRTAPMVFERVIWSSFVQR